MKIEKITKYCITKYILVKTWKKLLKNCLLIFFIIIHKHIIITLERHEYIKKTMKHLELNILLVKM